MTQKLQKTDVDKKEASDRISILVASDNHYAVLIAALLKSIEANHKTGEHIDFYIVDDDISIRNKQKLTTIVDPNQITIIWIPKASAVPEGLSLPLDRSAIALTSYYRVFSPYLIDQNVDKLIYIDVDTIVRTDISKLWNVDLGDYILGAVQNIGKYVTSPWGGIPNYKELGLSSDTKYFNAGVLLINTKKWREQDMSTQVIDANIKNLKHVVLADQYGLNVVFANKWYELDERWNWASGGKHDDPYLIHFLHIKPIFKSCYAKKEWIAE